MRVNRKFFSAAFLASLACCTDIPFVPLVHAESLPNQTLVAESSPQKNLYNFKEYFETHALSLFGDVKYKANFKHFDYVNPKAPKGGSATLSLTGGFDNLNPFNAKGDPVPGAAMMYDTLLSSSFEEPSAEYPQLAKKIRYGKNFAWAEFTLNEKAKWHDGKPITAADVIFSLDILKKKGNPIYRFYYADIVKAEAIGAHKVRFLFARAGNRELPLIIGQLTVLPKHFWEKHDFSKTLTEIPLGSGPYKMTAVKANRSVTYERVKDYWAKDLPSLVGQNNFDRVTFEVFRDATVEFEAFKSGAYDFRLETSAKNWAIGYDFPAVKNGGVTKEEIPNLLPQPAQGLVFNMRRDKFKDKKLREALTYLLDFEWMNENLFYGSYLRTRSFFQASELAATGLPKPGAELNVLTELKDKIPSEVMTTEYQPPVTEAGKRGFRKNLVTAYRLLKEAGYVLKNGKVTDQNGKPLEVEILNNDSFFEKILIPYADNLKKAGISATVRTVDSAQYVRRTREFDYDMIMSVWAQSASPGNEQREYWGSLAADRPGSRNYAGIKNPAIDALIEKLIYAETRDELVGRTRALDRLLQYERFMIPLWHYPYIRIAYRTKFSYPDKRPGLNHGFPSIWWEKP